MIWVRFGESVRSPPRAKKWASVPCRSPHMASVRPVLKDEERRMMPWTSYPFASTSSAILVHYSRDLRAFSLTRLAAKCSPRTCDFSARFRRDFGLPDFLVSMAKVVQKHCITNPTTARTWFTESAVSFTLLG